MDPDGAWRLAPAEGLTYARGLGYSPPGAPDDARGKNRTILDQVAAGLEGWERFAEEAGVHRNRVRFIASEFRRF